MSVGVSGKVVEENQHVETQNLASLLVIRHVTRLPGATPLTHR